MRILYFSRNYTTHDHRFLSALAKTEHRVFYLRLERHAHTLETRPLPESIEAIPWAGDNPQSATGRPATLRDAPRLFKDLRRVIRLVKPDLIHAGPLQRSAFLAALTGFRPLLSMSWGYDLIIDAQRNRLWKWATRYTLRHSALMIGDSEIIRQKAIYYGMPSERIVTFPWGVDLQHFTPPWTALNNESTDRLRPLSDQSTGLFTLLSTRAWEPIYGVEIIARAFVAACQGGKENRLQLVMLGDGSQAGILRGIFQEGGVADQVIFPGQVSQVELAQYYRSADLYISASHSDGTSISLLEALACGCPALVSDIPGNREWITPGVQGWWFPDGDATALAQAINHAVSQRSRLPEMGQAARQLAEARADWEKNFPKLLEAYARAVKKTAGEEHS